MADDIEPDYYVLEAIGVQIEAMIGGLLDSGALQKTLRRWLVGHALPPEDEDVQDCLMAMAGDLELFTPSPSGRTLVDRHLASHIPSTSYDKMAFQALRESQFRLVRIIDRESREVVRIQDLVTQEDLPVLDTRISPLAAGLTSAMRLCPLESGRHALISPLFALDEAQIATAMTFVRGGRPLGHGHRCAASLYRDMARHGYQPTPQLEPDAEAFVELLRDVAENLSPVSRLGLNWLRGDEAEEDLVAEARQLASVDNLVDVLGCFGQIGPDGPQELRAIYERIAALQVETVGHRIAAGVTAADTLDVVAAEIAGHIARGDMETGARELLHRLRRQDAPSGNKTSAVRPPEVADVDRVIQRIRALRTRTVDQGCTEAEAMAAAAKVSELLDRHDLTLDEISVRRSHCEGINLATGRGRRAPVDSCMPSIAAFCDCRVWSQDDDDGTLRFVFFGLKADVEAARFLHELITATFENESASFRGGKVYRSLRGGDRRMALNSFQTGLASGIAGKLAALKAARHSTNAKSTGFDLVAVKHSVLDEEIDRLGLNFTTKRLTSRRYVHGEAYDAGQAGGALFEPNAALAD